MNLREKLLLAVRETPGRTATQYAIALAVTEATVQKQLARLSALGLVRSRAVVPQGRCLVRLWSPIAGADECKLGTRKCRSCNRQRSILQYSDHQTKVGVCDGCRAEKTAAAKAKELGIEEYQDRVDQEAKRIAERNAADFARLRAAREAAEGRAA